MRPMRLPTALTLALAACSGPAADTATGAGPAVQRPLLQVFPSRELVRGGLVDVPEGALPQAEGGTPFPVDRVNGRPGFSPVQTVVLDLAVALDPTTLPAPAASGGSVQLWDATVGLPLPALVELDAFPDDNPTPALLVRPLRPVPAGHEVLVAVTDGLLDAGGAPLSIDWYEVAAGRSPGTVTGRTDASGAQAAALVDTVEELGLEGVVLAASFPVADPTATVAQVTADVPLPASWTWERVEVAEEPGELGEGIWVRARGTFETTGWLDDAGLLSFGPDGAPLPGAPWTAELTVLVPESLRDAPLASAPVWQFGHGIFSSPYNYLGDPADPNSVIRLADRGGVVMVATTWPGLTTADVSIPLEVAADFGRFPRLSDRLVQAVANQVALSRLLAEGDLLADPVLQGVVDPAATADGVPWFGISLGGIGGAVTYAHNPWRSAAVFHVGGASWSTMLERSDTWGLFESLLQQGVPDPVDRQLLIAASQLLWDPIDPAGVAADLAGQPILWQQALGDERVPNLSTELLARGAGATVVVGPTPVVPWGFVQADAADPPALTIQDPEVPLPPEVNRPPPTTGAHEAPRHWDGVHSQILHFLAAETRGEIRHFCGDQPCAASNPGE